MSAPDWRARFDSWLSWPLEEKVELVGLAALALGAEVAVRVGELPAMAKRLGISFETQTAPQRAKPAGLSRATIDRRAASVDRLYRAWPRKDSCLRRALVLGFRIRAAHPTLRIGVAKENDEIRAHAWIEVDGRVIGDETGDFAPLRRSGGRPADATSQAPRSHGR